jgi:hypothetical protein
MTLAVKIDGTALPDDEARAMWERFSAWMEEHRGDLAGFAKQEGFASAHPGVENGKPILLLSRNAAQRPYAPVAQDESSSPRASAGSKGRHDASRSPQGSGRKSKK